jgi:hypothetical protein
MAPSKSLQPTPDGAGMSAFADHVTVPVYTMKNREPYMRSKIFFISIVSFIVAATTLLSVAGLTIVPPNEDLPTIQAATNIVFSRFVTETGKNEQIVVSDPKQIQQLVSKMHLEPKGAVGDIHYDRVVFKGPAGELSAHFCARCLTVKSQKGERDYAMPNSFYDAFLSLARQHGWRSESK